RTPRSAGRCGSLRPLWRFEALAPELAPHLVKAHRAELERAHVERLEVEGRAVTLTGAVARLEPGTLADLVADRLSRYAEVARHLGAEERLIEVRPLDEELVRELRRPLLAGVVALP